MSTGQRIVQLAAAAADAASSLEALRRVTELRRELEAFERRQVAHALAEGATFARIARDLGVSRQAAHRRFRELLNGDLPLLMSPDTRRVLRYAREEASALGVRVPGGEHVVLAVLRAAELPAASLLRSLGATLEQARAHVETLSSRTPLFRRDDDSGDPEEMLEVPAREARERGDRHIEVEHLLLGALEDETGGAARTLRGLEVDPDAVRAGLAALLHAQPA